MLNGGELLASSIKKFNIDTMFGLVGNQISPVLVELEKYDIEFVGCHHEQAAVLMADGWAQVKRTSGVSIVSGGPGLANCVNGIIKAYMAATPLIVIVGGIVQNQKDDGQLQDMDQLGLIRNYCKWCATINTPERIPEYFAKAYKIANSNKRGPVVLEIPINVLKAKCGINVDNIDYIYKKPSISHCTQCSEEVLEKFCREIQMAFKPIILIGDEAYYEKCDILLRKLIEYIKIPIYAVNKGRGLVPEKVKYNFGSARTIDGGSQVSSFPESDLIIAFGISDDYQLNSFHQPYFNENQKIISVTELESSIFCKFEETISIKMNIHDFLISICDYLEVNNISIYKTDWIRKINVYVNSIYESLIETTESCNGIEPYSFISELNSLCDKDTIIILDGSNAMFWGSLIFEINYPGQLIIAPDSTHGSMGCGLPLALGAKKAFPEKSVLLYSGDGSMGFHIMELDTSISYNLPIKIVIHNDCAWGLCKVTQQTLYNKEQGVELRKLGFDKICESFGGIGLEVIDPIYEKESIDQLLSCNSLACLNVFVDPQAYSPGLVNFNELLRGMK